MSKIRVINFDMEQEPKRTVKMFPNNLRCGIFGPSGCGKTNVLLTILVHKKPLRAIYLCTRTASQSKYKLLRQLVQEYNACNTRSNIILEESTPDTIPVPEKLRPNSLVIFDDIQAENQSQIASFYMRGRHRNLSCFYLAQSYTRIPKKSGIRENFNYLLIFRQDRINLRQIYTEHIVADISFQQFTNMCTLCWRQPFGFLTVDLEDGCKFRRCFEEQINVM